MSYTSLRHIRSLHFCPYKTLNISKSATKSDIKKAYIKKAFEFHPDRNPADCSVSRDRFHQVSRAYEILSDHSKYQQWELERRYQSSSSPSSPGSSGSTSSSGQNPYARYTRKKTMSKDDDPNEYKYYEYDTSNWKGHPAYKGPRMPSWILAGLILSAGLSTSYAVYVFVLTPRLQSYRELMDAEHTRNAMHLANAKRLSKKDVEEQLKDLEEQEQTKQDRRSI